MKAGKNMKQPTIEHKNKELFQLELERFAQLLGELIKKYIDKLETENQEVSE